MKKDTFVNVIRLLLSTADSEEYITSEELAFQLNFSKRTILKCLTEIRTDIKNKGCELITKQGYGCKLVITDKEVFDSWYESLLETDEGDSVGNRRKIIFSKLLTANSFINIYDLADELYVSPSLVRKDIKALKSLIEEYELELKHSHSNGYMIVGDEYNIRKAIAKECTTVLNQVLYEKAFHHNTETLSSLHECIADALASYNITTTPIAINSLAIHILIAINRIETENVINTGKVISKSEKNGSEYKATLVINDHIKELFGVSLPEQELYYFSLHINGRQITAIDFTQVEDTDENEVIVFYNIFLRALLKEYNIDFFVDTNLRNNLLNHIGPFLHRLKNDMQIRKSNLSVIKDEFPFANELAVTGLRKIQEKYPYDISEEETLYFALHLALSFETRTNKRKYNIAIVMDDSMTVFNMMSYKITTALEKQVNMVKLFSYYNLEDEEILKFDIIVNATEKKLWFDKPTVTTREFLSDSDVEILRLIMHKLDDQQDIDQFMSKDLFFQLEAEDKDELIQKIISKVNKYIQLPDNFYHLVMEREKFGSTSYGNKIAVPHPISSEGMPEFISVCKLNKPIMWDDKYVQFVFMISLNTSGKSIQAFFSKLSKNILDNEKIFQLQKVENYEEFIDVFFK